MTSTYDALDRSVNASCCFHYGRAPKTNLGLRSIYGAAMLHNQSFGIHTAVKAAFAVGVSRPALHAAERLLQSQDDKLIRRVVAGYEPLLAFAGKVRGRVRLIQAFEAASGDDRIALGRAPATVLFDAAVASLALSINRCRSSSLRPASFASIRVKETP